ncbi:MAG: hypothetical protein LBJ77_02120 [Holosporales bacterium]|jgi:hypothetical protein|nr:hypothetical protein [Holosporales bacterium]
MMRKVLHGMLGLALMIDVSNIVQACSITLDCGKSYTGEHSVREVNFNHGNQSFVYPHHPEENLYERLAQLDRWVHEGKLSTTTDKHKQILLDHIYLFELGEPFVKGDLVGILCGILPSFPNTKSPDEQRIWTSAAKPVALDIIKQYKDQFNGDIVVTFFQNEAGTPVKMQNGPRYYFGSHINDAVNLVLGALSSRLSSI